MEMELELGGRHGLLLVCRNEAELRGEGLWAVLKEAIVQTNKCDHFKATFSLFPTPSLLSLTEPTGYGDHP